MFTSLRLELLKLFVMSSFFFFQFFISNYFKLIFCLIYFLNLHYFPIFSQKNLQGTKIHCQKKKKKKKKK